MNFAYAAVIVILTCALFIWAAQRRLIYFPLTELPSLRDAGLADGESVEFGTADGLRLRAWFLAGSGPPPRLTIVVFNGNAGNRAYRVPLAVALRRQGLQVLLTDYRGYGGNPGAPSEAGLTADARAVVEYLLGRPDVDRSRIVYYGESLGSAVALRLAVEHRPAALILKSPFTSLADIGRYHYPILPVRLLLRDRFASIDYAHRIECPVLVIAGADDAIVPIDFTRRLYAAITAQKTLVELPGVDHNDYELLAGDKVIQAIINFIPSAT